MNLTPREREKLLVSVASMVARNRLARGVKLNHPEAIALITHFVVEGAHRRRPDTGARACDHGRPLYARHPRDDRLGPGRGHRRHQGSSPSTTGDRPIQVGSHYHFAEANPVLRFDRAAARGMQLSITAGTAVRFEPGHSREVGLIPFTGDRLVQGISARPIPTCWSEVERDLTSPGEEVKFGCGKVVRDGMGQPQGTRADGAMDAVITGVVAFDHQGVTKADVGLEGGGTGPAHGTLATPPRPLAYRPDDGGLRGPARQHRHRGQGQCLAPRGAAGTAPGALSRNTPSPPPTVRSRCGRSSRVPCGGVRDGHRRCSCRNPVTA